MLCIPAYAATLCSASNLPSGDGITIVSFSVEAPSSTPTVGQNLAFRLTLRNQRGDTVYPQGSGIFMVVERPDGTVEQLAPPTADFNPSFKSPWDPQADMGFSWGRGLTQTGTWLIDAGYSVLVNGQTLTAPRQWPPCKVKVVSSAPPPSSPPPAESTPPPSSPAPTEPAPTAPLTDTIAPIVTSTIVTPTDERASDASIVFEGTARDEGTVDVVKLFIDGAFWEECSVSAAQGTCRKSRRLAAGTHTFHAVALDLAGNRAQSVSQRFYVADRAAPTVAIRATPINPREGENVTYTADATDASGVQILDIYVQGERAKRCTLATACEVSLPAVPRQVGANYQIEYFARAIDAAGASDETSVEVLYVRDTVLPTATISIDPETPDVNDPFMVRVEAEDNREVSGNPKGISYIGIEALSSGIVFKRTWCEHRARCELEVNGFPGPAIGGTAEISVAVHDYNSNILRLNRTVSFRGRAPIIYRVEHFPAEGTVETPVVIVAATSDDHAVEYIDMVVEGEVRNHCVEGGRFANCSVQVQAPRNGGDVPYFIRVVDVDGLETTSPPRHVYFRESASPDTDGDGLTDNYEQFLGTDSENPDTDGDALLDGWEVWGKDVDGDGIPDVNLPDMGAHPLFKDIFVEIDWMEDAFHSHKPQQRSLLIVQNAFARRGYRVHFDVGNFGWGNAIRHQPRLEFSSRSLEESKRRSYEEDNEYFFDLKRDNFHPARLGIFRYAIFGHERNDDFAGFATTGGNFFVALPPRRDPQVEASVLMHELGHTLLLGHGGRSNGAMDHTNFKTNYLSIMNYLFGGGVPIRRAGEIVYEVDYAEHGGPALDEHRLAESGVRGEVEEQQYSYYSCVDRGHGLAQDVVRNQTVEGQPMLLVLFPLDGTPVDWNCDGDTEDQGEFNINGNGTDEFGIRGSSIQQFTANGDWENLVLPIGCPELGWEAASGQDDAVLFQEQESQCPELAHRESRIPLEIKLLGEQCDGQDDDGDGRVDEGCADADKDGIADEVDNCVSVSNKGQEDNDGDLIGDACEEKYAFVPGKKAGKIMMTSSIPRVGWYVGGAVVVLAVIAGVVLWVRSRRKARRKH